MSPPSIRVIIGILGLVWGLTSEALYYRAGLPPSEVLLDLAIGWMYLYGGLAVWASQPANRTGRLMTLVGLCWFIGNIGVSDIAGLHEVAAAFGDVTAVALVALILAYPSGRLETRLDRATVAVLAIGSVVNNAIQFLRVPETIDLGTGRVIAGLTMAGLAGIVIIRRWFVAPRRRHRELLPVLIAGSILMGVLVINLIIQLVPVHEGLEAFLVAAKSLAPAAIPLALLVGFYRQSEFRQRALLDAMPDLMIRFTTDGRYLDFKAAEPVLLGGPVDPTAGGQIDDILPAHAARAVLAAATAAVDTGEIQTMDLSLDLPAGRRELETRISPSGADEVTAIVRDFTDQRAAETELRRSRSRIVEATDEARRRLERDLHDGAQQRLISASLALRLARTGLAGVGDPAAMAQLDAAADELRTGLVELRELARGIHPAILTEAGLGPAITALADRAAIPTEVSSVPDRRLAPAVEATAYFVVSEALTNVAKYADATRATIGAECRGSHLRVAVGDDGVGGADSSRGSGIRGLEDRVAAVGGRLTIDSPVGRGTQVVVEIPIS